MVIILICIFSVIFDVALGNEASIKHRNEGYFLHVTDFHYDPEYSISGDRAEMCHIQSTNEDLGNATLSPWGDYECDAPWKLVADGIKMLAEQYPNPDFILWTGDTPPHVPIESLSWDRVYELLDNATHLLRQSFPDTLIIPSLGNHDAFPQAQVPLAPSQYYNDIMHTCHWDSMITERQQLLDFMSGGFYRVPLNDHLVMLVLNTIFYYVEDLQVNNATDPDHQNAWLEKQLLSAKAKQQKVYISGHIAPGRSAFGRPSFLPQYNAQLITLLQKFGDIIVATFFGHEHFDHLEVLVDKQGHPSVPMYLAPALTPYSNPWHNPSLRYFTYDRQSANITEMSTLYMNLTDSIHTGVARWELAYNFTSAYNVSDVSAASVYHIAEQIKANNTEMLAKYFSFYSVLHNTDVLTCNDTCRIHHYCSIAAVDFDEHERCIKDFDNFPENSGKVVSTKIAVHAKDFTVDIRMLLYILGAAGIVLCGIIFAVCAFRTQELHTQYRYATFSKAHTLT